MENTTEHRLRTLGNWIRVLRTMRGLTQEELAQNAGLDAGMIGIIERGERSWGVIHVWPIADALQVPVRDLFPPPNDQATPTPRRGQGGPRLRPTRRRPRE
jgi:transcriptional regulator with XRE-family HTH domain